MSGHILFLAKVFVISVTVLLHTGFHHDTGTKEERNIHESQGGYNCYIPDSILIQGPKEEHHIHDSQGGYITVTYQIPS